MGPNREQYFRANFVPVSLQSDEVTDYEVMAGGAV